MRSALPMNTSGAPAFSNQKMRECSRNRPTIDRTAMRSLTPGTPGRRQQMPRTIRSIRTPACEAR